MADVFDTLDTVLSSIMGSAGSKIAGQLELAYDAGIIEDILKVLDTGQSTLGETKDLPETPATAYGASPSGLNLSYNAALARGKVVETIDNMEAGLRGYHQVVSHFQGETQTADETSSGDLNTLAQAVPCVSQPTFASPSQCTIPSAGGESS